MLDKQMDKFTLRAARVYRGLKQSEAAEKLNVDRKTLSNWERYVTKPQIDKIDAICDLYKLPYDMIIFLNSKNA